MKDKRKLGTAVGHEVDAERPALALDRFICRTAVVRVLRFAQRHNGYGRASRLHQE